MTTDEKKIGNGMNFKIAARELIIIVTLIVALAISLNTRASRAEMTALERRITIVENRLDTIRETQLEIKADTKAILERISKIEGGAK